MRHSRVPLRRNPRRLRCRSVREMTPVADCWVHAAESVHADLSVQIWIPGGNDLAYRTVAIAKDDGAVNGREGDHRVQERPRRQGTPIGPKRGFIAYLSPSRLHISDPIPVTIDGASAVSSRCPTNKTAVHEIFVISHDAFNIDAGEKIRFFVLDNDGHTVILTMDAFKAAGFDAFADVAQPVIDSITWVS
jgi:hypothetical protein